MIRRRGRDIVRRTTYSTMRLSCSNWLSYTFILPCRHQLSTRMYQNDDVSTNACPSACAGSECCELPCVFSMYENGDGVERTRSWLLPTPTANLGRSLRSIILLDGIADTDRRPSCTSSQPIGSDSKIGSQHSRLRTNRRVLSTCIFRKMECQARNRRIRWTGTFQAAVFSNLWNALYSIHWGYSRRVRPRL